MSEPVFTVLVIEDDRQIRRVVQGYLEQAGMRVLPTPDGENGLLLAQHEKPALIVLDLMLPGIDGWEITRRLRRHPDPAVANVHILMLTARVDEQTAWKGCRLARTTTWSSPSARVNSWRMFRRPGAGCSGCPRPWPRR